MSPSHYRPDIIRSRSFEIGFKDTMDAIKIFPIGGTDKFRTISDFKLGMIEACGRCKDTDYACGVIEAFKVGGVL